MKRSKFIIPLIFALVALAGIIQGAIMLLPRETKTAQAATVNVVEDRIGGTDSRFTNSAVFDMPDFYKDFSVELRLRVLEYRMIMINLKATYVVEGDETINATFDVESGNVTLYARSAPSGIVTASRISSNQLLVSYARNDSAYSVRISDIWVTSYTIPDLQEDEVFVRFVSPSENNLAFVVLNKDDKLTAAQIPSYSDFIPSLYRHCGWRTKSGLWAHEAQIIADMDFYPVMERNFEYAGQTNNKDQRLNNDKLATAYEEGTYDNATLARDFSSGAFKFTADSSIQATKDPILLTEFSISSMQIPWGKDETYFMLTLDVPRTNDFIPSGTNRKNLVLKSDKNYVYLMYSTQELKRWNFDNFIKQPQNKDDWKQNRVSITLAAKEGTIEWRLQHGQEITDNTFTYTGYLPDGAYRYGLNDDIGFLGLVGVNINRYADYTHAWKTGGFLGIGETTHKIYTPKTFPLISIKGCEAQIKKPVKCYIEGAYSFTANLFVNQFEKPVLPVGIEKADNTIRWYLDSSLIQELLPNFHTALNYNALYGKWVPAEYDVTLIYYTVDRFRADLNGGKYYDALVKKTYTKTYTKGSVVNLNDYGADIYGVNFYDNIQQIKFLGWDKNITAPITGSITITGQYKFPNAMLRYYDVDDKLYGTVTQEMTMFPVDILLEEVKQANSEHPEWWLHGRPEDKGLLGRVYGFFESIARSVFGGDNIGNGANASMRDDQIKDTRYIIEQLEREHNTRNAYGENRQYFLPVVYLDINLEQLNKGAYGNEAFNVREEDNPQWHLISGTPKLNNLVYYADVHNVYSLDSSNFTMVVNFDKKMDGFDTMAKRFADTAGWFGKFFGGIFGNFFGGLFKGGLGWLYTLATIVIIIILGWYLLRPLLIALCILLANLLIGLLNKIGGTT